MLKTLIKYALAKYQKLRGTCEFKTICEYEMIVIDLLPWLDKYVGSCNDKLINLEWNLLYIRNK